MSGQGQKQLSDYLATAQRCAPRFNVERFGESMHANNVVRYRRPLARQMAPGS
jgi:hypothetical protein